MQDYRFRLSHKCPTDFYALLEGQNGNPFPLCAGQLDRVQTAICRNREVRYQPGVRWLDDNDRRRVRPTAYCGRINLPSGFIACVNVIDGFAGLQFNGADL
ncbi:hypothetical protein XBFFL1_1040005 [Xenorhabdus bovienii str. feltiae Florida]|nr:hypothetical protein XBFFR1_2500003 [Xenorhabdus bovienii str. feltiae France]CDG90673.1 hypothetical protein XBFFL1_1040005 [Xenorhabdus bovienii str. feltiae Florida]